MTPRERAKEMWDDSHWTTRMSVVFGLIGAVWLGLTAAGNATERWLLPRREHAHYVDSVAASSVLHGVRDSARQERIERRLSYLICRSDGNSPRACAHLR